MGVVTVTWPINKVSGSLRIFGMAKAVHDKFGRQGSKTDKQDGASHYFFSFCDPSIIWPHEAIFKWCTLSECSCLFCRRMCCRDAAVAFKVFCLRLSCSDSLLFQADSCSSVSFPSHGRVHWRSKVRTALHIQHREMWINLDGEGIDQLPHSPIWGLSAILDSASSDVLR